MDHEYEMIVLPYKMMSKIKYLPILKKDGKEIYRGEYQENSKTAMERIQRRLDRELES
jgi:hypothetical protein